MTMVTPDERPPNEPPGRMRTTRLSTLVVAVMATAGLAWLGIDAFYGAIPHLPWLPPLTLFGLALVEAVAAWQTRARITRRAGAGPVEPLLVARYVVLAKASALAGALFAGTYLGVTGWLLAQRGVLAQAAEDLPPAVAGVVASFALTGAALWLEYACRVPPAPRGGDAPTTGRVGSRDSRDDRDNGAES